MKKILLIALICHLAYSNSFAQIKYGIKAGLNYVNNVQGIGEENINKYKISYHFGGYSIFEISDKIGIQSEILYSNKGYKFDATDLSREGNLNLNYINLPILAGYSISNSFKVNFGPEFGYLLSAKSKFDSSTVDVGDIWDNNIDLGIATGIALDLTSKFMIEMRYSHGLISVIDEVELTDDFGSPTGETIKFLNRTFQISVGYNLK